MNDPTARVQRCTAQRRDGQFCDGPPAPEMPFPICSHHAIKVFVEMRERLGNLKADPLLLWSRSFDEIDDARDRKARAQRDAVVYYVAVGDIIKIGVSTDLPTRLRAYPPHRKLLATEAGGHATETLRLREFAEYLHSGNEWFTMGPRLMDHIKALRAEAA